MKLDHSRLGNNNHRHSYNNWKNDGLDYDYYYLKANEEFANLPYDIESRPAPQVKSKTKKILTIVFLWWYLLLTLMIDSYKMGRNLIKVGKKYIPFIIILLTTFLTATAICVIYHTNILNTFVIVISAIMSIIIGLVLFKHIDEYKIINGEYEKISDSESSNSVKKENSFLSRKSWIAVVGTPENRDYIDVCDYSNLSKKYQYLNNEISLFNEENWHPHGEFYTDDAKYYISPDL